MRVADAESLLLLLLAGIIALAFDQAPLARLERLEPLRGAMFSVLAGAVAYGALRLRRERSVFGAGLFSIALLILVGAIADALKYLGMLPAAWPVATALIITAFLLREAADKFLRPERDIKREGKSLPSVIIERLSRAGVIRLVADCAVVASASLWFTTVVYSFEEGDMRAAIVLFLALLYWGERAARLRRAWPVYLSGVHLGALCLVLQIALRVDAQWFAAISMLALFPFFLAAARYARARSIDWLADSASMLAGILVATVVGVSIAQALNHLRVADPLLLAPSVALGLVALLSFGASLLFEGAARVRYFRAGLYSLVLAFALACLRAGYDPLGDIEIYSSPVAILLLVTSYLSLRRRWDEYALETGPLLWIGSLLLAAPLLIHALEFRLLWEMPALWRDLATLCASLALIIFGVLGRIRAPLLVGSVSLLLELLALTVTSVDWLQIPLKVYLMSVGALILLFWGLLEFRREQLLRLRERLNERRDYARERFGEWR